MTAVKADVATGVEDACRLKLIEGYSNGARR